jgi:hypothetical protein
MAQRDSWKPKIGDKTGFSKSGRQLPFVPCVAWQAHTSLNAPDLEL